MAAKYRAPKTEERYREPTPIPGPEAFEERSRSARMSQAAFLLATSAGIGGHAESIQRETAFPLPAIEQMEHPASMTPTQAMRHLDADSDEMLAGPSFRIAAKDVAPLARDVLDQPDPMIAASLIEGSLHSPDLLVRTAAAASALDTTGPREDIVAVLEEGSRSRDNLVHDIARTGLARARPHHPRFRYLVGKEPRVATKDRSSNTALITHGTFARRSRWWTPTGNFYGYLDGFQPSLDLYAESFPWSGAYSHEARQFAAEQLHAWLNAEGIDQPDFFAHSHGGTVAHLSTHVGTRFDRLVLLSWPHHRAWHPRFQNIERIIDIRVGLDLVIMADRGGQRFKPPRQHRDKVEEHKNGWFSHGDTHTPSYWDRYDLPSAL